MTLPANSVLVPAVKQGTGYSCGPAAALALLRFWLPLPYAAYSERDLYRDLRTTEAQGTEPEPMVAYFRAVAGLEAEYRTGDVTVRDLERAVEAGHPPIVDLQAWRDVDVPYTEVWDAGHYVIFVGYDATNLFFMDPSKMAPSGYAYLPRREIDERWHDLAGDQDVRLERMTIFVRGKEPAGRVEAHPLLRATKLG